MFFIQMSGFPGSGKSTLARFIAKETGAIIVDHDIIKSALLHTKEDIRYDSKFVGAVSYDIDWSLIDFYLSLGQSVIFDSPCLYEKIVENGINLSEKYHVKYKYIECYVDDIDEIKCRLTSRERMISQIQNISCDENFYYTINNSKKPVGYRCLIVDSKQPLENYKKEVIDYIRE